MSEGSFEERAPHEQGFAKVFRTRIQPVLDAAGEDWAATKRKGHLAVLAVIGVGFLVAFAVVLFAPGAAVGKIMMLVFITIMTGIVARIIHKKVGESFNRKMAEAIGPILCEFMGVARFQHDIGPDFIGLPQFRALRLVTRYSKARVQDGLEGEWRGVRYRMAEARLFQRYRRRNQRETLVFHGVLMRVESPTEMPTILFLREAGAVLGWLREQFTLPSGMERLPWPDPEVEAAFQIYARDTAAAQAAITPAFGRTLLTLRDEHPGARGYLTAAFDGRELLLAFRQSRDFLNLGAYDLDPGNFAERTRGALEDLTLPRRVIDTLVGAPGEASPSDADQRGAPAASR
jgi:hypothetical protein